MIPPFLDESSPGELAEILGPDGAQLDATSGIMPAIVASAVIRIGRNRNMLAWRIASRACARKSRSRPTPWSAR